MRRYNFAGFDAQQWYKHLFDYGIAAPAPGANAGSANGHIGVDADEELVPKLVREIGAAINRPVQRSLLSWKISGACPNTHCVR